MMSEGLFTGMIALFWLAEFGFGLLVAYWFITQGFDSEEGRVSGSDIPLEDRSVTIRSLAMWAGFFAIIILGIIVGA